MIPFEKVQALVKKHDGLEKELSSSSVDPKTFAEKSKEYASLGSIINYAREYVKFDDEKRDLEQILNDKNSDKEMAWELLRRNVNVNPSLEEYHDKPLLV